MKSKKSKGKSAKSRKKIEKWKKKKSLKRKKKIKKAKKKAKKNSDWNAIICDVDQSINVAQGALVGVCMCKFF